MTDDPILAELLILWPCLSEEARLSLLRIARQKPKNYQRSPKMTSRRPGHASGLVPDALSAKVLDFIVQNHLGLHGIAAAADVISADCKFQLWVLNVVKKANLSEEKWLLLLENGENNDVRCLTALKQFSVDKSLDRLCVELEAVRNWLTSDAKLLVGLGI